MDAIIEFLMKIIEQNGILGVFLGVFTESIFPPIPSEAILGYAGFLIGTGKQAFIPILIASILGKIASSIPIWYLGKKYGHSFIQSYGKYIGYTMEDYYKAEKAFEKYGFGAVFFSQFIPLVRSLISVPAGALEIKFWPFLFWTALGAGIWNTLLLYIGTQLGENWHDLEKILSPVIDPLKYIVILVIVGFVVYQAWKVYNIHKKEQSEIMGAEMK
jgi:membrane protein DedA with SNARE-associated domain